MKDRRDVIGIGDVCQHGAPPTSDARDDESAGKTGFDDSHHHGQDSEHDEKVHFLHRSYSFPMLQRTAVMAMATGT
jgi:hypothetical protein